MQRLFFVLLLTLCMTLPAWAHGGRRFEVKVVDNQLVAHGYNSGTDDGGGFIRPYYNAIHGHFSNLSSEVAYADLPGYDVFDDADAMIGYDLTWQIVGFSKWATPAMDGPVSLSALDSDEVIEVGFGAQAIRSDTFTAGDLFTVLPSFNGSNGGHIDLSYTFLGDNPVGEVYVIESLLSTSAPGVASSTTVYTLLSPDGSTMAERLHHHTLHAESELGTPVPEPSSLVIAALLPLLMRRRRGC